MKSILRQLKKYKEKRLEPVVDVSDDKIPTSRVKTTIYSLAHAIAVAESYKWNRMFSLASWNDDKQQIREEWITERTELIVNLCRDLPIYESADLLYPLEILCTYHCFYNHKKQVTGEKVTNKFLMNFLLKTDISEYIKLFEKTASKTAKILTMTRVIQATFGGSTKLDRLPTSPFRVPAAAFIGISATLNNAVKLQESIHRSADIEDIILGRIGYLMIWHWWDKQGCTIKSPTVPLLTHS